MFAWIMHENVEQIRQKCLSLKACHGKEQFIRPELGKMLSDACDNYSVGGGKE